MSECISLNNIVLKGATSCEEGIIRTKIVDHCSAHLPSDSSESVQQWMLQIFSLRTPGVVPKKLSRQVENKLLKLTMRDLEDDLGRSVQDAKSLTRQLEEAKETASLAKKNNFHLSQLTRRLILHVLDSVSACEPTNSSRTEKELHMLNNIWRDRICRKRCFSTQEQIMDMEAICSRLLYREAVLNAN